MKKIYLSIILLAVVSANSQVRLISTANSSVNSSAFIDASSQNTNNATVGTGKGLVYPRVDLTTFLFVSGTTGISSNFPTRYDGMVVYNTGTGNTLVGSSTTIVAVTPGFYYYNNKSNTLTGGVWTPIIDGNALSKNVTSSEVMLNTKINGAQLYAINGTFTADGTSTIVSVPVPSGMTGYYSFVTYTGGKTYRREINSFSTASSTNNVVTGSGSFSEVLPAGTYSYVLEYFK